MLFAMNFQGRLICMTVAYLFVLVTGRSFMRLYNTQSAAYSHRREISMGTGSRRLSRWVEIPSSESLPPGPSPTGFGPELAHHRMRNNQLTGATVCRGTDHFDQEAAGGDG